MRDEENSQPDTTERAAKSRWWHWMLGIGLAIPALPVLAFLVLYLLDPARTLVMVGMLLHPPRANTGPPAMFADQLMTGRVPDKAETSRQLTARLQQQFPVGTTEAMLKAALLAQGFKPLDTPQNCQQPVQDGQPLRTDRRVTVCPPPDHSRSLKYDWGSGICGESIWVHWSTDASDVITLLDGYYNIACR